MKSFATLFTSLVLTAAMLTGCGCTNRNVDKTTPTTLIPTTLIPTTEMTTAPTTQAAETTHPTETFGSTDETINHGNGPLVEDGTNTTEDTTEPTAQNRARQGMPIR